MWYTMTDLDFLALRQSRISKLLKKIEALKKQVRLEFFEAADGSFEEQIHLLPMTSISVPQKFFEATGMSHADFLGTRYPSWSQTAISEEDGNVIFVLRRKRDYMPFTHVTDDLELARSVSETTPEIDWDSMEKVEPDLFKAFAEPVTTYTLNTESFNRLVSEDKTFDAQAFLARYTIHKAPTLRVLTKVIKKDE